jgi:hypothetical protein
VALHDPTIQNLIAERFHCSGAMQSTPSDYVMAVDANIGGGKDNYWLSRALSAQVQLRPDGTVGHALTIRYLNAAPDRYPYKPYQNYLRVYLPEGAQAVRAAGLTDWTFGHETGHGVVSGWMTVPFGKELTIQVNYELPNGWSSTRGYRLYWQKQAGTRDDRLNLELAWPAPSPTATVLPATGNRNEQGASFSLSMTQDQEIVLTFQTFEPEGAEVRSGWVDRLRARFESTQRAPARASSSPPSSAVPPSRSGAWWRTGHTARARTT